MLNSLFKCIVRDIFDYITYYFRDNLPQLCLEMYLRDEENFKFITINSSEIEKSSVLLFFIEGQKLAWYLKANVSHCYN